MIKKLLIYPTLVFLVLLIGATFYVLSGDKSLRHADIRVENARIKLALPGQTTAVLYFDLVNNGGANQLLTVSVPGAKKSLLHESIDEDGVMKMRHLTSVKVEPKSTTSFAPNGKHVMLMGFELGENKHTIPIILTFARPPLPPAPDADKNDKPIYTLEVEAKISK